METAPAASFADLLRRFRASAGLSQEALAERAGLSVRAISDLERGARRSPYRETIRLLAAALDLTPADRASLEAAADRGRGRRTLAHPPTEHAGASLPAAVTPLIGREQEMAQVQTLLRRGDTRLLTLTGPPGIGKTRLALAIAAANSDRAGEVVFVGLAPIADPRLVATSILHAFDLAEVGGRPAPERLKDVLRDKRALLVLDNFEQVVSAAPLIGELLEVGPGLSALVTSRVPLHLRGEHEFPVPPLSLPGGETGRGRGGDKTTLPLPVSPPLPLESDAVRLFVDRAQAVRPDFALTEENTLAVAEICRRLDGLPLAIELAAARSKVLTPKAMLGRLEHRFELLTGGARDAPARHQTLRAAITWSHDLLTPAQQTIFRRLGVFVGGWTLEAAEAVAGGREGLSSLTPDSRLPTPDIDVLDGLAALVDQSLVQQAEGADGEFRFVLLETLREYALEQLDAAGERDRLQHRHAADVLALAEEAEPHLFGGDRGSWLLRLSEEQDNIRAALGWLLAQNDPELGLRLVGALWLWFQRRLLIEGRRWGEDLLSHPGAGRPTSARASALFATGHFAWLQGDVRTMRAHMEEAVAIRRQQGDAAGLGRALPFLGLALGEDHEVARRLAEEGVACCRQVGDRWGLALALTNLGRIEATWGHDDAARPPLEEATALFRALGDGWLLALPLTSLGAIAYRAENYEAALTAFAEALPCFRAVEDRRNTTQVLTNLGYTALARGEIERAREIFGESLAFGREHGDRFNTPACLRGFAAVAVAVGDLPRAARLFAAADARSAETGAARWPAERLGGPVSIDDLRRNLGDATFAAAWTAGQQLTPEQAIAEAEAAQTHAERDSPHPGSDP